MNKNNIKTLSDFAELINSSESWLIEFFDIIKKNGWNDNTSTSFGICDNGKEKLEFNSDCSAVVLPL